LAGDHQAESRYGVDTITVRSPSVGKPDRWRKRLSKLATTLPVWIRATLLAGASCLVLGVALFSWHYYSKPAKLTVAVGSLDGDAPQAASVMAGQISTTNSTVRLEVQNVGDVLDAAKALAAGKADLALVRADVGDFSQARSIALMGQGVAMLLAPPGSNITSIEKLKGRTVGVVGGEVNHRLVEALKKEYDLDRTGVKFKDLAPTDIRRALQAKEVNVLLLVVPLSERYLTLVRGLFRDKANSAPVLIPIDSAAAIAEADHAYESYDIPKGTLRGAPAAPDDDVTTLRVGYYLVANRHLDSNRMAELAKRVMNARRNLLSEQPILAGIAAPNLDPDSYIAVHPGAAAYYNGTEQSFVDRYSNAIYLTPMLLGALASIFAAAWRFLGIRPGDATEATFPALYALPRRIRAAQSETDLAAIEGEVDALVNAHMARTGNDEDATLAIAALNAAAQRLESLIHQRRMVMAAQRHSTSPAP
jgi:TRAP-type uncharacterized transport system substrate-binding protein